ncbi:hypothetical protein BDV97DRAFT_394849 [Delphinella strobiligena]|nr:hypothetical protein BDV97DRAFT_394849 [Delphinella strobiligena]
MVLTQTEYARGIGAFHEALAVDVGPERRRFYLHTKLLAEDSEFFKAATEPRWDAPGREALDLSDEDPSVFEVFAIWLYERVIAVDVGTLAGREKIDCIDSTLMKAYGFAQRRLSPRFSNAIISAFGKRLAMEPFEALSAINMSILLDQGSKGSTLWRLMTDFFTWLSSIGKDVPLEDCQNSEFFIELAKAQALHIRQQLQSHHASSDPRNDLCKYHQHDEGDDKLVCDLSEPSFNCGNRKAHFPECGTLIKFTAGREAKTFHVPEAFLANMRTRASKLCYSKLDCAALELFFQWEFMEWDLTDVVRTVYEAGSPEKDDAVLMQLIHLYYIGVHREDRELLNGTTDAIAEWTLLCQRTPPEQCLSFAYDYAVQLQTKVEGHMKLVHLLAMLFAWIGTYTVCENVHVLQVLAVAQSSLRDTYAEIISMPLAFPMEGEYRCKHFHFHHDGEPACYVAGYRSRFCKHPFSRDNGTDQYWGDFLHNCYNRGLEKLPFGVFNEQSRNNTAPTDDNSKDNVNDVDGNDEHRHKRARAT